METIETIETTVQLTQDKIAHWCASEAMIQGKTIRIEEEFLPDHDVKAVSTPRYSFDMDMLRSGVQDLTRWAREAVHTLVAELPTGSIITVPQFQVVKTAYMVEAQLALYVMTPNDQVEF